MANKPSRHLLIPALVVFSVMETTGVGWWSAAPAAADQHKKTAKRHAAAKPAPNDFAGSFQSFCQEWMEKVRARETHGVIEWQTDADSVQGKYVEYGHDYTCTLTPGSPPIGKVNYRETWYEKRGKTIAEAEQSTAQPVQVFDTSELFSYAKGKWTYQ